MPRESRLGLTRRKRFAFIGITLGALFLVGELVLQAYYYAHAGAFLFQRLHPPICQEDEIRCYAMRPNLDFAFGTNEFSTTIYTNSQGFRTDARRLEVPYQKADDVYRILFLGPSLTFGWGSDWEDTYPTLIAEGLRVPGKRIEIINLGTPAQEHGPQLCWLQKEGVRFAPDMVVSTVYGTEIPPVPAECPEDLRCPYLSPEGRLYGRKPSLTKRLQLAAKNLAFVFYGFYAYHALAPSPAPQDDGVGIGKEFYSEEERRTGLDPGELARLYQRYVGFVKQLLGSDAQVAFIHIPLSYVVHEEDVGRWRQQIRGAAPRRARSLIATGVEALRGHDIAIIDSTSAMLARQAEERLYYWLDIHPTPAGNRVIAEAALPVLQRLVDGRRGGAS